MNGADGGPAFPRVGEGFGNPKYDAPGMSLRDWFAGQALAALSLKVPEHTEYHVTKAETIAQVTATAYQIADAMLAARAPTPSEPNVQPPGGQP